jgi:hypothetical protein
VRFGSNRSAPILLGCNRKIEALADSATRQRLVVLGDQVVPRDEQTPERLRAFYAAEIEKWWPIIKAAEIKVQ